MKKTSLVIGISIVIFVVTFSSCIITDTSKRLSYKTEIVTQENGVETREVVENPDQWWQFDIYWRQSVEGSTWVTPGSYCNISVTLYARTRNENLDAIPVQPNDYDGVYFLYFRTGRHTAWQDFYTILPDEEQTVVLDTATYNLTEDFWTSSDVLEFNGQDLEAEHNARPENSGHLVDLSLDEGVYTYYFSWAEANDNMFNPEWQMKPTEDKWDGPKINNFFVITATWEEYEAYPGRKYILGILLAISIVVLLLLIRKYIKDLKAKILFMQASYAEYTHPQICKDGSQQFCPYKYIATNTFENGSCRCIVDNPMNRVLQGYTFESKDSQYRYDPIIQTITLRKLF